jgi:hypothetical protein
MHAYHDAKEEPECRVAWDDCVPLYRRLMLGEADAVLAYLSSRHAIHLDDLEAIKAEETRGKDAA